MFTIYAPRSGAPSFELLGMAMPNDDWQKAKCNLIDLLRAEKKGDSADFLEKYPFEIMQGTNTFMDEFFVLHFYAPIPQYIQLKKEAHAPSSLKYENIVKAFEELEVGYLRFIAASLETNEKPATIISREYTGWERLDRTITEAERLLGVATTEEQFQSIGFMCREALISLAQEVFDKDKYPSIDGTVISDSDAKRMLEAYFAVELSGDSNEFARKLSRAALDQANKVQHRRTAGFKDAAFCLNATIFLTKAILIVNQDE